MFLAFSTSFFPLLQQLFAALSVWLAPIPILLLSLPALSPRHPPPYAAAPAPRGSAADFPASAGTARDVPVRRRPGKAFRTQVHAPASPPAHSGMPADNHHRLSAPADILRCAGIRFRRRCCLLCFLLHVFLTAVQVLQRFLQVAILLILLLADLISGFCALQFRLLRPPRVFLLLEIIQCFLG